MLADHVEAQLLQHLKIVHHCLLGRRGVNTIRPEALIQSTEHEDELSIEKGSNNTVDLSLGDGAESSIALDNIVAQLDCDVVQSG